MAVNAEPEISDSRVTAPQNGASADVTGGTGESAQRRPASAIEVRGLTKAFGGDVIALKEVDLHIAAGEFFTLLGPSGCGKTTLLRLLAGLERPTSGEIEIGGKDVTSIPPHKRSVNTVFQSYALFQHMTVGENIGFGLRMRGQNKKRIRKQVEEISEFIKIGNLLDRKTDQLSGGQQQRVALARALINEPDVLLLDEPLSALDAGLRGDLQVELLRIQKRLGMTFIFVTHDQQEALVMSDRIAVLHDGRIQQVGEPRNLYETPHNLFVASFMGHHNLYPIRSQDEEGVTTEFGRIKGRFEKGTHLLVRPEAVVLSTDQDNGEDNQFSARVQERIYRGNIAEYLLVYGETTELIAKSVNVGDRMFDEGDQVTATINANALVTCNE